MTNSKKLYVTVTAYEGDVAFPEAAHYSEYVAERLAQMFSAEVETDTGPAVKVFAYGFGEDESSIVEEVTGAVKVDLWDDFCVDGYQAYSAPIETDAVAAVNESTAVAVGKAVLAALETRPEVDVEGGDNMDDADWSELRDYLARRGVTLRGGVAYADAATQG